MDKTVIYSALILGLVGIIGLNLKAIFSWFLELFMDRCVYSLKIDEASQFFYGIQNYVVMERSQSIRNFYYRSIYDNFIDGETTRDINLFYNRGLIVLKLKTGRIFLVKDSTVINNTQTPYKNDKHSFYIYSFSKNPIDELITHISKTYMDNKIRYHFNNNGEIMSYGNIVPKTFDNIFLNGNQKETIINDLDSFNVSQSKFIAMGLKYKWTFLFHGGAGGGKSSIAIAMANYTKRDILTINISKDMTDSTLISLIAKRPKKSIILFEDIDCLFEELTRDNKTEEKEKTEKSQSIKITLSCLLNILDGSFTPNDVIFVITTNHLEKLDHALIRNGRVNRIMYIDSPDNNTKNQYIHYLAKFNPKIDPSNIVIDENVSMSTLEQKVFE